MQRDEHQDGDQAQADRDGDGEGSIGSDGALSMVGQVAQGLLAAWDSAELESLQLDCCSAADFFKSYFT